MYKYLDKVNSPNDIKKMTIDEIDQLSNDIRKFLVKSISQTGGHLASNLGVVELTLALHKVFDTPKDKIVWDVGHQSYVHKLITGRKEGFKSLRKFGGMSGFPKESESEHDSFDTGHSSTSISVATGYACARDIKNEDYNVVAVIGDGSITGGMALEALNHLGDLNKKMIVVLNDNEMSIDKNVGGMAKYMSNIIRNSTAGKFKDEVEKILNISPGGNLISKTANKFADSIIGQFTPQECGIFESFGIKYYGPIDGHNTKELLEILESVKHKEYPVLLHVITKKGKGYRLAENQPDKYHGVGVFNIKNGISISDKKSISSTVGEKLTEMAVYDDKVVAITAAMPSGTGLNIFERRHPKRYFDVGIAEQHATTFAAGLAKAGLKPYFAVYSSFLQRGFDQLLHDVCITKKPVRFLIDRAGLVGNDGETHHGIFDLSYFNIIPNIVVMAPKDTKELELMMDLSLTIESPLAIRYPRGNYYFLDKGDYGNLEIGKSEIIDNGNDVLILAIGNMVKHSIEARNILLNEDINPTIVNARFLKPLDEELLHTLFKKHKYVVTVEDNVLSGGYGSVVNKFISDNNYDIKICNIGIKDEFIPHGDIDNLYSLAGISANDIADKIKNLL